MKILLVGSNGQLASHYFTSNFKKKITFFSKKDLDISKKNRVLDICKDLNPKYIINCAAFSKVNNCEIKKNKAIKVNSIGPKNLSIAAKYLDIPIIHFSSDYVFNGYLKRPYNEKDIPDPINFYGKTKLDGENYIRNITKKHLIFRVSWLFGKSKNNFVYFVINNILKNNKIRIVNDQFSIPTYCDDLIDITIKAISKSDKFIDLYGTYHFTSNGKKISWYNFALQILKFIKKNINHKYSSSNIIPISTKEYKSIYKVNINRPKYSVLDSTLSKKNFNFYGKDWNVSLEKLIRCYKY